MTADDLLRDVLQAWQIEPVQRIDRATSGTMNETFIVTTDVRQVVLRRHRRTDLSQIEHEHDVVAHARHRGIPTPAALVDPDGNRVVERGGAYYSLFALARGGQLPHDQLNPPRAWSMGQLLGRLHLALADYPVSSSVGERRHSGSETAAQIEHLLRRVEEHPDPDERDHWATEHLRTKLSWLDTHPEPVRHPVAAESVQQIHGDYQHTNLFFVGDTVVDVIDWDKTEARWPLDEIIRTLALPLGLRPELGAAMITGYRSVHDLSLDELDLAAANYSYGQVHGHWLFEGIYLSQDDRLRIFLEPGPFVPFTDRWAAFRPSLR